MLDISSTRRRRVAVRLLLLGLLLAGAGVVAGDYVASSDVQANEEQIERQAQLSFEDRTPIVGERDNVTVISTQGFPQAGRFNGSLISFGTDGRLLYFNNSLAFYADVDPVPGTTHTVTYVAGERTTQQCEEGRYYSACMRIVIERANLTTGETERLYSSVTTEYGVWHDVDRVNETHFAVANINRDSVFIVNVTSGLREWTWRADQSYDPLSSGGSYPGDWTHVNDVEVLEDGRLMVSLRNHDQVVFLSREGRVIQNWTLGADDDHETLYEQHNPDYIPAERGGPAVIVADSENNRIVEYQRENSSWNQTWEYSSLDLQWPRDGDRLPNGHTLITSSNGDEVIEVDETGAVVWRAPVAGPYEAERLGTGDESTGGQSAAAIGLSGQQTGETAGSDDEGGSSEASTLTKLLIAVKNVIPSPILNGIIFLRPLWLSNVGLVAGGSAVLAAVAWVGIELKWSRLSLDVSVGLE